MHALPGTCGMSSDVPTTAGKLICILAVALMALSFGANGYGGQLSITSVAIVHPPNPANVPKYSKVELLVTLSNVAATNPYEADPARGGLDLRATFKRPDNSEWTVNGFFDGSSWRIRFAPDATGTWSFDVAATDSSGTATWTGGSFTCVTSEYPGWLRIDGHYLRFTEGQVFFGVGHNTGWQDGPNGVEEPSLADMASRGENLLSFWLAAPWDKPSWGPEREARAPIENIEGGIGNYNQVACAYLDYVVESAETAGVYLLPTIWSHGQLRDTGHPWGEGWWANNAYSTVCSAAEFFELTDGGSDTEQWRLQQNFYRYLIARWGHSRAVAGWVAVCEIQGTTGYYNDPSQAVEWCDAVREYFRANDDFRRNDAGQYPVTVSVSDDPSWDAGFDMRANDSYSEQTDDTEVAATIATQTAIMRANGQPAFHGEFGGNVDYGASQPTHLHNGIWAGAAAGAAMTPLVWTDGYSFPLLTDPDVGDAMRDHLEYLSDFMEGLDTAVLGQSGVGPTLLSFDGTQWWKCGGWGMRADDVGFAWLQKTNGNIGGQSLTIEGLPPGTYTVLWYDVWTSGATPHTTEEVTVGANGELTATIPAPGQRDIALKFAAQPTAAVVSSFRARSEGGRVVVEWETASEVGTVGFNVSRRSGAGGAQEQVGGGLMPGLLHAPQGGRYRLVDSEVKQGRAYVYKLLEVEAGGRKRSCGACRVTVAEPAEGLRAAARAKRGQAPSRLAYSRATRPRPAAVLERATGRNQAAARHAVRGRRPWVSGAVKIAVREDGLYYVAAAELAPLLGESPQSVGRLIRRGHLSLTCQGKPVAYLPVQNGAGLYFYGQGIDSIYTDENVYWLKQGLGVLMDEAGESGAQPPAVPQTFTQTLHAEEDLSPATGLFTDPEADFWLWDYLVSGQQGLDRKSFTVRADGAALVGEASLTVHLKGATDTEAERDHHARISLNGTTVGEARWDGLDAHALTLSINPALLRSGANTVTVEGVLDTGVPYSIFYVDSFDVAYQRLYEAVGDCLLCRAEDHAVVTIGGFTQPQILVLDVTMPRSPSHVVGTTVEEVEGGCRVSFASLWPDAVYLAVTPEAAKRPSSMVADEPSRLKHRGNGADYVVIAPAALREAAQALAAYRRGQRLATMVVDLEDIYDEFHHGIATPKAIQSFLAYACGNWRREPRYVVLAGNGTYDYKDHLGFGGNLVPPLLMSTGHGLFAADRQFAPELAIGRLPANNAAELGALVQKIIAYERRSGPWTRRVIMAADNPDGGGDYARDSDELAGLVPAGYATAKVYLSRLPLNEARQQLIAGFHDGALLINYMGHGGPQRLAHEGLLTLEDVSALNNADRLPVVTTLTCLTGRFAIPGYDCLGEALVLHPSGGAIAFWGPAGLLLNSQSKALGAAFLRGALGKGKRVLGDAILEAHQNRTGQGSAALELYNLLGDPGLKLRRGE